MQSGNRWRFESSYAHYAGLVELVYTAASNTAGESHKGSNPLSCIYALVAQSEEAIGLSPIKCEFESHRGYFIRKRKEVRKMVTVNMVATGANIKNMMKARNIKVKDVQAVCGFGTPQAIFKWMRGDCMPTIDNMIIIADMFDCKVDDIVVVDR